MTSLSVKNNDIHLNESSSLVLVSGIEEIRQSINNNIASVDFIDIFKSRQDIGVVGAVIKQKIIETDGVISISRFDTNYKGIGNDCNSFNINFSAYTEFGLLESSNGN